jgi:hypothetical protein
MPKRTKLATWVAAGGFAGIFVAQFTWSHALVLRLTIYFLVLALVLALVWAKAPPLLVWSIGAPGLFVLGTSAVYAALDRTIQRIHVRVNALPTTYVD